MTTAPIAVGTAVSAAVATVTVVVATTGDAARASRTREEAGLT